jgi:hypothetical protein
MLLLLLSYVSKVGWIVSQTVLQEGGGHGRLSEKRQRPSSPRACLMLSCMLLLLLLPPCCRL